MSETAALGVAFDPLPVGDRGLRSATRLMLLLNDERILPSVSFLVLLLLPSDARSSSEGSDTLSIVSDISFWSTTERCPQTENEKTMMTTHNKNEKQPVTAE